MADPPTITDSSAATDTSVITATDVANTAPVLAGSGAAATQAKTPQPLPTFQSDAEVVTAANEILKLLGFGKTTLYAFSASQGHTPKPHIELRDCGFAAWTNSSSVIYIFDGGLEEVRSHTTGEEQRVSLWGIVVHESGHAKTFSTDWKGSHPPSYSAGLQHEQKNYTYSGKWLSTPNSQHKQFKGLVGASKDAKTLAAKISGVHMKWASDLQAALNAAPPKEPARNDYLFAMFVKSASVPASLETLPPAQALTQTYGY